MLNIKIELSVIGIRSKIDSESTVINTYMMGSDFYQPLNEILDKSKGVTEMAKSDGTVSNGTQPPNSIGDWAKQETALERQIISITTNQNIDIEDVPKQIDELYAQHADRYTPEDWEIYVTSLTYEIEQRCLALEKHLESQRQERNN